MIAEIIFNATSFDGNAFIKNEIRAVLGF